jgi:uridine kinase
MTESGSGTRRAVIDSLADAITSLHREHPTRVAVDGWSAVGKTTLADELAAAIQERGRPTLRASIDDFHRKGHKYRSMRGEWTPRLYYEQGYDYAVFRAWVLEPLGPGGSRRCRTALLDSFNDVALPEAWQGVTDDTVAIVDGIFLLRPALADLWDYVIWLEIDVETMVERACKRDVAWVGSVEAVERRHRGFWQSAHNLYEQLDEPSRCAHAVIDNRLIERPRILRIVRPATP